ncbi:ubiquitin-like modifier-activating enzyme ATG7 [Aricia agestis]|uniref:ubiquitin-like modifier-activating enzyme ATG7 n=1 Tax=Aricia agestis TaxID=91739 RepID=UPI001C2065C2|nr:ubiquitin-like modifier-activating enzyme ATG7 [Aricia agestis]
MSTAQETKGIIQYVPFKSFVHPAFWHTLSELKLNVDKLNETTKQIHGIYSFRDDIDGIFEVDGTSFNQSTTEDLFSIDVIGTLINKNTIEDFKGIDKAALLNSIGEVIWTNIKTRSWIDKPNSLVTFIILSFADLKKFHYYYWFAFPTPNQPTVYLKQNSTSITDYFSQDELKSLTISFKNLDMTQKCFFCITKDDKVSVDLLSTVLKRKNGDELDIDFSKTFFAFADPSSGENPGWPLRLFIAALLEYSPSLREREFNVIGIRCKRLEGIEVSRVFTIKTCEFQNVQSDGKIGWVGWERNDKGNFGPKLANMSASMDPKKLADASSNLNIQLMKWRLVPDLDVDIMKETKCLLLGAGTLGCHVARNLLAWGFRHITFIDNGKVSYSNPTRQVLYTFEDCLNGGKKKAETAAVNLKRILPTVHSEGLCLHIPMPGHPIGESLKDETINNINIITKAIADHDVIFLLLDTREARWLPTLIAAQMGKIVINAALGFDSYLVMRHGTSAHASMQANAQANTHSDAHASTHSDAHASTQVSSVRGSMLGCYFCNDVTAPGNSVSDRTLDQQCTVSRPGAAATAGALAVELLVGMLQHPDKIDAPAPFKMDDETTSQGILGAVPHSIRGFLHNYQTVLPTCVKFRQCIACSDTVIDMYRTAGTQFLLDVFNSGKYLEKLTGLTELQTLAEMTEIVALSDDDED